MSQPCSKPTVLFLALNIRMMDYTATLITSSKTVFSFVSAFHIVVYLFPSYNILTVCGV